MNKTRSQMAAIIRKDLRGVTSNHRMMVTLLVVPLAMMVVFPTVFLLTAHFVPEENAEFDRLLALLPLSQQTGTLEQTMVQLLLNYILPPFFLLIPIMASSVMAAASFVGEKEKRTLETLLYSPLSLRQVFQSKVLAAFLLSMFVSLASFGVMLAVLGLESFLLMGTLPALGLSWLPVMLLVSPSVSLIAVTLIVRVSAKAKSVEDAQQGAVFLLLPVLLLIIGQFSGILLLSGWLLLGLGLLCAALAAVLLHRSLGRFTYEALLEKE